MLNSIQLQNAARRARAIAASGHYDEDCVRRLLEGLEEEFKEASAESKLAEALQGIEHLAR